MSFKVWWRNEYPFSTPEDMLGQGSTQFIKSAFNAGVAANLSDLRQLAEAVLKHHAYSCHWCTIDQDKCEKYKTALCEESCCQCPKCLIARRYAESEAGK